MTKRQWFLISGVLILLSILVQLLKLIHKINQDKIDSLSGALVGVGIAILLITLFRRKNK
jgi:glycopeptide antibiotics resistance protein